MNSLESVFNAQSVAVVGASTNPEKTGHEILRNIVDGGYQGKVYPINPKAEEILGLSCYPSIAEIGKPVDLVVIVVPSRFVPEVIEEAGKNGAKGAVIISGGFSEIGNDELESQVVKTAEKYGVRIIGPNCQGFNYTPNKLCASWPLITKPGSIAIISQSGTVGATLEMWAEEEQIGLSGFVALGNKSDINEIDLIDFFKDDPTTNVISLYIEGVRDGKRFMEIVREARKKKPIVVLKPGKTEKGMQAVQSHTHSIAGKDEIFNAVCKQTGITRAKNIDELYDFSKGMGFMRKPKGNRLLVLTSSGGSGILATDMAEENGIDIAALPEQLKAELKEALPPQCVIANPLDLTGDASAERYQTAAEIALKEPSIDSILLIFGDPIPRAAQVVRELRDKTDKEIIVAYLGGGSVEKDEKIIMHQHGIPVFPTPERAVGALKELLS